MRIGGDKMSDKETAYVKARRAVEALGIGDRVSASQLAETIGVTATQDRKAVAAFLSQQAQRGRMQKHAGEDKRMYYEKVTPPSKSMPSRAEPKKKEREDTVALLDIGERIANYMKKLEKMIEDLEKERDRLKEKLEVFSKQKEEFKRLYQETEARSRELSRERPKVANSIPVPQAERATD